MGSLKKLYGWYPAGAIWKPIKVDANGKVVLSNILSYQTKARAYLSADQLNLVNNTWTKVLLDTENYDIGANFASYKFTAPVTGYYLVAAMVEFTNVIADKFYSAGIYVNNAGVVYGQAHSSNTNDILVLISDIVFLNSADYVELFAYQSSGVGTVDIYGGVIGTYMAIHLLST